MHRFYVPPEQVSGEYVSFTTDQRKQIGSVLRLVPGDLTAVFDGSGIEYTVRIDHLDSQQARGLIIESSTPNVEPSLRFVLAQGLPKGERLDFILQKCTEIGVSEFVIMETRRSVPRIPADRLERRLERWRAIVREASEQSGRTRLPKVKGVIPFDETLSDTGDCDVRLIAWEEAGGNTFDPALPDGTESVACFIGPEGGFTPEEAGAAQDAGANVVSLGSRILRTETAAVVMASVLIYSQG